MIIAKSTDKNTSHWYSVKGEPRYGASLREARKELLLPSVTEVLNIMAKPGLEAWKQEQAILSALTLPRSKGERDDEFARRIVEDSKSQSKQATEFGSAIHAACETINLETIPILDSKIADFVASYESWKKHNIKAIRQAEFCIVNLADGYAGKCDLLAETCLGDTVIDIKTQGIKGKVRFYETWGMQLAAYARPLGVKAAMSVVIPSHRPGDVECKIWPNLDELYGAFKNCLELWMFDRDYYPNKQLLMASAGRMEAA